MKSMTPYKRVIAALHKRECDMIPFTVYSNMIPQCSVERELRNQGLCIIKSVPSYNVHYPNVKINAHHYKDQSGRSLIRTIYTTPVGDLTTLTEPAGYTDWTHEYLFKKPEDYKTLMFMVKDIVIKQNYSFISKFAANLGEDFAVRDHLPLEPIQRIINDFMGTETFCFEWMDNRDEILKLYDALVEANRKFYPIVAKSPQEFANYGGNVVPQIIGRDTFEKYYIPNYNEAAEVFHKHGKLIGCHFDADNSPIMDLIGKTDLDYIEAYDAGISPSIDVALKQWPDKVLWLNWPSAWHMESVDVVRSKTRELIKQAGHTNGFLIGITEDVPEDRWQGNFIAIMDEISKNK